MRGVQMLVYEDNFGFWDVSNPEERIFFDHVQRQSVLTACERCERPVRLIPPTAVCASCVSALEYGAPMKREKKRNKKNCLCSPAPGGGGLFPPGLRQFGAGRLYRQNERIAAQG